MKRLFIIALCPLVIFSSCDFIHNEHIGGTGNVVTETRDVSNFTGVDVGSAIHLYVKQDSVYSVKVETDDNLQQYILVDNRNGVLHIRQRNNTSLDPTGKIKVYITAPVFKRLGASGACEIVSENTLSSDAFDIHVSGASEAKLELLALKVSAELSGASKMTLKGETRDLSITGSGSSRVRGFDLVSENADIEISGASSADVYANVKVSAEASGASSIRYKGSASIDSHTSGASSAKKAE